MYTGLILVSVALKSNIIQWKIDVIENFIWWIIEILLKLVIYNFICK